MEKYKITRIYKTDKDKMGQPLMGKGKPYTRMSVKVAEHGDKWISGFEGSQNKFWKEDDIVEMIIEQKGEYLNFSLPKKDDLIVELSKKIELALLTLGRHELLIKNLTEKVEGKKLHVPMPEGVDYPEEEINSYDVPF